MSEQYEGWANYPTWAVKLWIDNGRAEQEYWREVTAEALADIAHDTSEFKRTAEGILADTLKEEYENDWGDVARLISDVYPDVGVYIDLMAYALGEVNWYEIAHSLIEEADS